MESMGMVERVPMPTNGEIAALRRMTENEDWFIYPEDRHLVKRALRRLQYCKCSVCGKHLGCGKITLEHCVPKAMGTSNFRNVTASHKYCNEAKGAKHPGEFELTMLGIVNAAIDAALDEGE